MKKRMGKQTQHALRDIMFGLLLTAGVTVMIATTLRTTDTSLSQTTQTRAAEANFDQYCRDGVYYVQKNGKEISCGRAPNCDGRSYDSVTGIDWRSNAECWVEDYFGGKRCNAYCAGNIPLCCYKLAITKNDEDCPWPERGYCHPTQCQGVGNNCGGPIGTWCTSIDKCIKNVKDVPLFSLESRLAGTNQPANPPTNTPLPQAPTATNTPTRPPHPPTSTPVPQAPTAPALEPTNPVIPTSPPLQEPTPLPMFPTRVVSTPFPTTPPQAPPTNPPPIIPTSAPIVIPSPTPTGVNIPRIPTIAPVTIESPKEIAQRVINPETVGNLERTTEKPLAAVKEGVETIVAYDKKLESAIERFFFSLRVRLNQLLQER